MASWEKEQVRLLKLFEEISSGSSNSESESDADSAEKNSLKHEKNQKMMRDGIPIQHVPETFLLMQMPPGFVWI